MIFTPLERRAAVQLLEPAGNALGIVLAHGQGDGHHLLVGFHQLFGKVFQFQFSDVFVQGLSRDILEAALQETAGEGGPYGMALLAGYMLWKKEGQGLEDYLNNQNKYGNSLSLIFINT